MHDRLGIYKHFQSVLSFPFLNLKYSAGGMYTTANDLAKFINQVILSPNSSILSRQQVREWLSPLYVFTDRKTAVGYSPSTIASNKENALGNLPPFRSRRSSSIL
jgi:CubicO group peptidase (beta-lactamase class C family)